MRSTKTRSTRGDLGHTFIRRRHGQCAENARMPGKGVSHGLQRHSQSDGGEKGIRPFHHRRYAAEHQGRRASFAGLQDPPERSAKPRVDLLADDAGAARGISAHQGMQLCLQRQGGWTFSRQRLRAARFGRHGAAAHRDAHSRLRRTGPAGGADQPGNDQARHRVLCRRHRHRQVHLAGGDGRLPQPEQLRAHHLD